MLDVGIMATLHVRRVPEELHECVHALARAKRRSLSAQVIALLQRAVADETRQQQQAQVLDEIRRQRFAPPQGAPDAVDLLREDRAR